MSDAVQKLRGLWREINALGGTAKDLYDTGINHGILQASLKLEAAGFEESYCEAADEIESLRQQLAQERERREKAEALLPEERKAIIRKISDLLNCHIDTPNLGRDALLRLRAFVQDRAALGSKEGDIQ